MASAKDILSIKCTSIDGATAAMQALALDETERFILNYCNLVSVPLEANYLWANMALDLLKGSYLSDNTSSLDAIRPEEVGSMSAGDMSVSRDTNLIAHKVDLDSLLFNYREQLNQFRRIPWGGSTRQCWGL